MSGRIRTAGAAALLVTIAAAAPAQAGHRPLPNLREASVKASVAQVELGGTFTARDKVRNTSRRKLRRSVTGFYLSDDGTRSGDDFHLSAFRRVPRLRPHRSSSGVTTIDLPSTVGPGTYRLIACADYLRRIRERRERDNCAATSGTIEVVDPPATLLAAGDVADCSQSADSATADLLAPRPGTVAMLGDGAYPGGSSSDYGNCYRPTWGRVKPRTRPVPGDHDYDTADASGYFGYFGAAAGEVGRGWYSYEVGAWHVIALNSVCSKVGGCGPGSAQMQWLAADLQAHPATCTLAYWHTPKYSGGSVGGSGVMDSAWNALRDAGAEVVLNGNNHDYERFAPIDGIREFVVGTGGAPLHPFKSTPSGTETRDAMSHGVLQLTLRADGYDWQFVPAAGGSFTDSGGGDCH